MSADPKLYRKLEIPFSSQEEASKAIQAFTEGLKELRKKHRVRDFAYSAMLAYESNDGESDVIVSGHLGNSLNAEAMLAYALGAVQSERQAHIGGLLRGVKKGERG